MLWNKKGLHVDYIHIQTFYQEIFKYRLKVYKDKIIEASKFFNYVYTNVSARFFLRDDRNKSKRASILSFCGLPFCSASAFATICLYWHDWFFFNDEAVEYPI